MNQTRINRYVAVFVFLASFGVYLLTLSPTVVFWDVGEFIAAAQMLQVPHPPGSPLFLLGARIAMMIPFAADIAVRAHAFSALLSALGIVFTYLVIIELFRIFQAPPAGLAGKVGYYGAAVVGALALAFGTTYWDNSIEAEVYGASMFFLTAVFWLVMRWRHHAGEPGNEKYVLLIAYLIGLSLGVHLLSLLVIFPVLMVMYFRRYEVTPRSFAWFSVVALGVFFVVYPGIVKFLPGLLDGDFNGRKSELIAWLPWIVIAGLCYGVYVTYVRKKRMAHVALLSMVLILLGYTTYTTVLIRANATPPMNENDPSNLARLTAYLGREQYGDAPLFMPRRWSQDAQHQGIYTNYTSDMDYMLRYQLDHMFVRYLLWNFVGSAGDAQDSGVGWKETLGIPFLIGLLGLYYQFRRDWKMGLVFTIVFIITGPVLALYQNQQEPQPRERDYFYVGAYMVFAVWISYGLFALLDLARRALKSPRLQDASKYAIVGLCVLAVPVSLIRMNWRDHNRSGNYVAWDYSYNMLQTCEKDALLFTNGDNDTFPLWYLQDVEGVRRDVRIVNLSLVNTPWYIQQMKNKPYYGEAQAVPISLSDQRIQQMPSVAAWRTRKITLPVPPGVLARYGVTDSAALRTGSIEFTMKPTLTIQGTPAVRAQDLMVLDIIQTNQWKRPVYFAVTCSPDSRIGMDDYLWFQGLAYKFEPRRTLRDEAAIDPKVVEENLFNEPQGYSRTPQYGYKFRGLSDPKVHFDENTSRLMINLRFSFIKLANYYATVESDYAKSAAALDRMEVIVPRSKVEMGWELTSDLAAFYRRIGRQGKFDTLMAEIEPELHRQIDAGRYNLNTYYNPFRVLLELYDVRGDLPKTYALLKTLQGIYPNDQGLKARADQVQARLRGASPDSAARRDTVALK